MNHPSNSTPPAAVPVQHGSIDLQVRGRNPTVATTERGDGDDLVVFLHGLGCDRTSFEHVIASAQFAASMRVIAFDFPGHGDSPPVDWGSGDLLSCYAGATADLVQRRDCGTVHLVGHSLGGAVAVLAAGMLEGMADLGAVVSIEGNLTAQDCGTASRSIAESSIEEFARVGVLQFVAERRAASEAGERAWAEWMARTDPLTVHRAATSLVAWSDSGGLAARWQRLGYARYLWGQRSGFPEHLRQILTDHCALPDSGHFPMIDNPEVLAEAIGAAIDQAEPGPI